MIQLNDLHHLNQLNKINYAMSEVSITKLIVSKQSIESNHFIDFIVVSSKEIA